MNFKDLIFLSLSFAGLVSCMKNDVYSDEPARPDSYTVAGKVEKGPFIQGSTISMATLNPDLTATGKTYAATIVDDAGTFGFGAQEFDSQYARLTANGYFYNEVSGQLSSGTLTLSALVDLSGKEGVNVNILTHLKAMRLQKLVEKDGKSFKEADMQAQKELMDCFGMAEYAGTDASQFSITAGTDEAAALIVVSSQILVGRTEAEVTEFISKLSVDFAEDGQFSQANNEILSNNLKSLFSKTDKIAEGIVNRYSQLGIYVSVKDIKELVDWDGDGIRGNEFLAEGASVRLSTAILSVPAQGGVFEVEVSSPVAVYLSAPSSGGDASTYVISDNYLAINFYETSESFGISFTKELKDNKLILNVAESRIRCDASAAVPLYTFDGKEVVRLMIIQSGASKGEFVNLGPTGATMFMAAYEKFSSSMTLASCIDRFYTKLDYYAGFTAPVHPDFYGISNYWSACYGFVRSINMFKMFDEHLRCIYPEYANIYSAINYYNMVVFWGGVPYITDISTESSVRDSETAIFDSLSVNLKASIEYCEEGKNVAAETASDKRLFLKKDVARIALADIYMYQGKYADAKPLLETVIEGGNYSFDRDPQPCYSSNDCIFAVDYKTATKTILEDCNYTLIYSYTDVVLSYAECCFNLGEESKAKSWIDLAAGNNSVTIPSGTDNMTAIKTIREALKLPGYFAFLKRTGMAKAVLGLEEYQLLLPIPSSEVAKSPGVSQNPGY